MGKRGAECRFEALHTPPATITTESKQRQRRRCVKLGRHQSNARRARYPLNPAGTLRDFEWTLTDLRRFIEHPPVSRVCPEQPRFRRTTLSQVIPLPRLEIRPGRTEDFKAVSRMVADVWREVYGPYLSVGSADPCSDTHIAELVGNPGTNGWVAILGRRMVGYCNSIGNCIEQVWVDASMRRQGIGTELTLRAINAIRSRGFAFAQAGCEDFNTGARAFLEAGNWICISAEARLMSNGRNYDAMVYSRSLA